MNGNVNGKPPSEDKSREIELRSGTCTSCEGVHVLIADTGLCAACCFGEADALEEFDD